MSPRFFENRSEGNLEQSARFLMMSEDRLDSDIVPLHSDIVCEYDQNCKEKPYVGQTFADLDDVYSFYRKYAKETSFDIRKSSQKAYVNKFAGRREIGSKVYLCNKEGTWNERSEEMEVSNSVRYISKDSRLSPTQRRRTGSFRCGCKASLTVKLDFNTKIWTVTSFKEEHNHNLTSPSKKHFMKHSREISVSMSNFIEIMESIGFSNSQISRLIATQSGGYNKTEVMMSDIKNFRRDKREDIKNYDAEIVLEHFTKLKSKDSNFFFAYKTNDDSRLTHLFWEDSTCKQDYELFGEAMTFDTTFKMNQYHMIFAGFCGVNHHRQTIFFCAAFIINETKDSFIWLFDEFNKCMGKKSPNVIITDQDRGMKAAIEVSFPNTVHRLCCWHILSKLPVKIGVLANKKEIMREFGKVVWESKSTEDFELGWKRWIDENDLDDNEWLCSIFELRKNWVPIFLVDVFSAGMKTTQRSEGMNAFLRSRVTQFNTLYEFIIRYEEALRSQREKENYNDHMDRNRNPCLQTNLTIEKQASAVYTTSIFHIFQENLKDSLLHGVKQSDEDSDLYIVFPYASDGIADTHYVKVLNRDSPPRCSCHYYEFIGIPCCHILSYMNFSRQECMHGNFIKNRWTKGIKDGIKVQIYEEEGVNSKWGDYMELTRQANELINSAIGDDRKKDILCRHMIAAKTEFEECQFRSDCVLSTKSVENSAETRSAKRSITMFQKDSSKLDINIKNPPFAKTKGSGRGGRPKLGVAKRYKSNIESATKKPRTCKKCGMTNAGHDSRNCPSQVNVDFCNKEDIDASEEDISDFSE